MQRSIKSFFQPKPGGAVKKEERKSEDNGSQKEKSSSTSKNVSEHPLKERNGTASVDDSESPVKRIPRKTVRVLDSDDEESMDVEITKSPKDNSETNKKTKPATPPAAIPKEGASVGNGESSKRSASASSDASMPPSDIPKRKTARKQITKRKLENTAEPDIQNQEENAKEAAAKRQKKEADEGLGISPTNSELNEETEQCALDTLPEKTNETCGKKSKVKTETKEEAEQCAMDTSPEKTDEKKVSPSHVKSKNSKGLSDKFFEKRSKKVSEKKIKKEEESKEISEKNSEGESKELSENSSDKEVCEKAPEKSSANTPAKSTPAKSTKSVSSFFGTPKQDVLDKQAEYNPSKSNYHPVNDACWTYEQMVPYLAVARTFEMIEDESARLKNIETLSNFLRSVICLSPGDLLPSIYLCLNRLGPAYEGIELGIGETILMKAVAQATGRQLDKIKAEAQEKGDLGLVAESSRSNQRTMFTPPKLTVSGVFNKLKEIAKMAGNASMNKKIDIIKGLFVACRHSEARYIARSLGGKLRIGLAELSVLAAIAQAVCLTPPGQEFPPAVIDASKGMSTESKKAWIEEHALILKQTFCELPNYDAVVPALLKHGIKELPQHCHLTPGVPLKPMLAHPTKGVTEVLKRFEEAAFTCEYKYDGERAQIHILENGEVHIYSRNQENNTSKYPDIISRIPKIGTGFTDEDLESHYNFLKDHVIDGARSYYRWDSAAEPDHWFEPVQVWEVKCADLSISPVHKAAIGLVEDEKGISLRFPRFLRIRDDKKPEDATSSYQVAELYKKQQQIQNTTAEKGDDDFY
ncbi:DNA ligase 1 [Pyxicephalus adspersus]|uniref:DNA ligase 1 n=1 Tax=Pyxicephalus adspersus TaxID=30357 RepID=UPI003B5AFFD2